MRCYYALYEMLYQAVGYLDQVQNLEVPLVIVNLCEHMVKHHLLQCFSGYSHKVSCFQIRRGLGVVPVRL